MTIESKIARFMAWPIGHILNNFNLYCETGY